MKTAKEFLKEKKLKDTLYDVESDNGSWIKDGLSGLLDEYASQFQQEWIPVEVRLPEENIPVLCTNVNGVEDVELLTIGLRYKDSTSFYLTEINQLTDQVTHWMPFPPLPQPYNPTKS